MYVSILNVRQLYLSREREHNWDEDEERDMNEYLEEEIKIWKVEHPATAKKMLGEENEAEEGDEQGNDGEDGFGMLDVGNEHLNNCSVDSDNESQNGRSMLGLKSINFDSPMANQR